MGRPAAQTDQPAPVKRFAETFRQLVRATRMPLDRLGERVGKSATALSNYQTGRRLPPKDVVAAVHAIAKSPPLTLEQMLVLLKEAAGAQGAPTHSEATPAAVGDARQPTPPASASDPHDKAQPEPATRYGRTLLVAATATVIIIGVGIGLVLWSPSDTLGKRPDPRAAASSPPGAVPESGQPSAPPHQDARRVCAQHLLVRSAPQPPRDGARRVGMLYAGEYFSVERYSPDSTYAYGLAHGRVRKRGWVDAQWLCAPGETPPPALGHG